jgi:hypothetical protein
LKPLPSKVRIASLYLQAYSRLLGYPLPEPVWIDLRDPRQLAVWLVERVPRQPVCVRAPASSTVRVAVAAREHGLSLDGVCFITLGEPFTEAKQRMLEAVGARPVVNYASVETGAIGYLCANPDSVDDLHLFSDSFAMVQRSRTANRAQDHA